MAAVNTYNPKKVIVTIGGETLTGYADGTFISADPNADKVSKQTGADGETGRALANDNSYVIELTLLQTSSGHDLLNKYMKLDKENGEGTFDLEIIDKSGKTLLQFETAWVRRTPTLEFAKELSDRTWTIDTAEPSTEEIGGNNSPSETA